DRIWILKTQDGILLLVPDRNPKEPSSFSSQGMQRFQTAGIATKSLSSCSGSEYLFACSAFFILQNPFGAAPYPTHFPFLSQKRLPKANILLSNLRPSVILGYLPALKTNFL